MTQFNPNQLSQSLPRHAYGVLNRCNLPAPILGGLHFQKQPSPLAIDSCQYFHRQLFDQLDHIHCAQNRAENFSDYMKSCFLLDTLHDAGLAPSNAKNKTKSNRSRGNYLSFLRGWLFSSDSREGAVLKSWVESRFGLLVQAHHQPIVSYDDNIYQQYLADRAAGIYGTNAIESQFDVVFSYCQYEVSRRFNNGCYDHIRLYRGINALDKHQTERIDINTRNILFNNLNSFTNSCERASEFGDYILCVDIPTSKLLYMPNLLPNRMCGENEYLVLGGVYRVSIIT